MIKSMTGFGRGESGGWITEIRTVNHRFGDIHFRIPRILSSLEGRFKEEIKKRVKRGRVEVTSSPDAAVKVEAARITLDEDRTDQIYQALTQVKERFGFDQDVSLDHLMSFPDIFKTVEDSPDLDQLWQAISPSLTNAINSLDEMRVAEGSNLMAVVMESLSVIEKIHPHLVERAPEVVEFYRERLTKRMESLLPGEQLDEGRMLQEAALFADRSDITEELARLLSHLEQFHTIMESPGPHGRKMEFLLQEMNREINTIGSKGNDMQISRWVVAGKSELEKIREQILNVE
jgi:uncharacterized protein (TIGR00255 family)